MRKFFCSAAIGYSIARCWIDQQSGSVWNATRGQRCSSCGDCSTPAPSGRTVPWDPAPRRLRVWLVYWRAKP